MESLALALGTEAGEDLRWWLMAALAGVVAIAWGRAVVVSRMLRTRREWVVLAADEFDPSPEQIGRFAHQLARVQSAGRRRIVAPGCGVRVSLTAAGEGQVVYSIAAPRSGGPVVRAAMYDRVELKDSDSVDLRELVLAADSGGGRAAEEGRGKEAGAAEEGPHADEVPWP